MLDGMTKKNKTGTGNLNLKKGQSTIVLEILYTFTRSYEESFAIAMVGSSKKLKYLVFSL